MSDLIPTRDRIMALLSPPSQEVYLTVEDARWIGAALEAKDAEIKRLEADSKKMHSEIRAMVAAWEKSEAENERLRTALEQIKKQHPPGGEAYIADQALAQQVTDSGGFTYRDISDMGPQDFGLVFPLIKHRLFEIGLLKTAHEFDKAQQVIGFEIADLMASTDSRQPPEEPTDCIRCGGFHPTIEACQVTDEAVDEMMSTPLTDEFFSNDEVTGGEKDG